MRDIDYGAALRATLLTALVLGGLLAAQSAVTATVTGGEQPMRSVSTVPTQPGSGAWADAPGQTVDLSKQQMAMPFGGGSVDELHVKALTNETHVAFRLRWDDPTNDTSVGSPRTYSDAAALMFRGGELPPITMGSDGAPVNIWYWRANWQFGTNATGGDMYAYPHPADETKPGLAAGNPISAQATDRYAANYYAKGFGSLTHAPTQRVRAVGERTETGWQVSFVRERTTDGGRYDAAFNDSQQMFMAFAVWNGSENEVNGQKSITLTFSTLDTKTDEINPASPSSGSSSETSGESSSADDSSGSDGSSGSTDELWIMRSMTNWTAGLVLTSILVWSVAYWRIRE